MRSSGMKFAIALVNLILSPRQFFFKIHNLFDLHQKPAIDLGQIENLFEGEAGPQGVAFNAFWPWVCRRHISHGNRFPVSAWLVVTLTAGWH